MVNFSFKKVHSIAHEIVNEVPERLAPITLRQNLRGLAKITILKDGIHSLINSLNGTLNVNEFVTEPSPNKRLPVTKTNKRKHLQKFNLSQLQNDRLISDVKNVKITSIPYVLFS